MDVLLLQWEDDDLGVKKEVEELASVLRTRYNFTTWSKAIPSTDPEEYLANVIQTFRKGKTRNDLLIVYYGGHTVESDKECIWIANYKEGSPRLNWHGIEGFLLVYPVHVLLIFDCCYATQAARRSSDGDKWFLGSSGKESRATGVSWKSFTTCMTRELERCANRFTENGEPFSVHSIHSALTYDYRDLKISPNIVKLTDKECPSTDLTPLPLHTVQGQLTQNPASISPLQKEERISQLKKYDTVFLVDDSGSMSGHHWKVTAEALAKIADIAVKYDRDGVDVRFFNHFLKSEERKNLDSSQKVMALFERVKPEGTTPTAETLEIELNEYLNKFENNRDQKMLNLIMLTDGEPDVHQNVEDVIVDYVNKLRKLGAYKYQVGVQFVQIGNDKGATEFLRVLDDDLVKKRGLDRDVRVYSKMKINADQLLTYCTYRLWILFYGLMVMKPRSTKKSSLAVY